MEHYSVLLQESVEALNIKSDGIYVDGTLGRGGHSLAILKKLSNGTLYAIDKDETAIAESKQKLAGYSNCHFIHTDFRNLKTELLAKGVSSINGMILDLGVSSPQFDDPNRGFSYRYDSRLDMRMDLSSKLSAYEVVNLYPEEKLSKILWDYGEEKYSRQIARAIVKKREQSFIETTFELVDVIKSALPAQVLRKHKHPAKQTFQALRIEVNDELNALKEVLYQAIDMLDKDGVVAVISFHSLEDRIVKTIFNEYVNVDTMDRKIPVLPSEIKESEYEFVFKKPIEANSEELDENNRSHSAKLRAIRRK